MTKTDQTTTIFFAICLMAITFFLNNHTITHAQTRSDLTPVSEVGIGGFPYIASVDNGVVYLSVGESLKIVDASDTMNPTILSTVEEIGYVSDLELSGNLAYITNQSQLLILDVANPENPIQLGTVDINNSTSVQVVGNTAYVTLLYGLLATVDVSDPAAPVLLGTLEEDYSGAVDVQIIEDIAYISAISQDLISIFTGLVTVDISDPAMPRYIDEVNTNPYRDPDIGGDWAAGEGRAVGLSIIGNIAYLPHNAGGVARIDVSNPNDMSLIDFIETEGIASPNAVGIDLVDNIAYIADANNGIIALDVSDPAAPVRTGTFETDADIRSIHVEGNLAYVANRNGLSILDVTDAALPTQSGSLGSFTEAMDSQVIDETAYVLTNNGLVIMDVNDKASPIVLSSYELDVRTLYEYGKFYYGQLRGIDVQDNIAYIGGNDLFILDVADPMAPVLLSTFDRPAVPYKNVEALSNMDIQAVDVVDNVVYVADSKYGVVMLDVSIPANPQEIGGFDARTVFETTVNDDVSAMDIQVVGDNAYVAYSDLGLLILDVSDPANPTLIGSYKKNDNISKILNVYVEGNIAYITGYEMGVIMLDVTDPASPVVSRSFQAEELDWIEKSDLDVVGNKIYITDSSFIKRLYMIDANSDEPTLSIFDIGMGFEYDRNAYELGFHYLESGLGIEVVDDAIYLASDSFGIFDVGDVQSTSQSVPLTTLMIPLAVQLSTAVTTQPSLVSVLLVCLVCLSAAVLPMSRIWRK